MAYHFRDGVDEMGFMATWQTLRPALLLTVQQCVQQTYDASVCALPDNHLLCVTAGHCS